MHGMTAMTKKDKPKRGVPPLTARPKTVKGYVDHPRLAGAREEVERIPDSFTAMFKRKQITDGEYRAGEIYRNAYDVIYGSIGGAMDPTKVHGAAQPGMPPPMHYMDAAERLRKAKTKLYALDHHVVDQVCGHGLSIEKVTQALAQRAKRLDPATGRALRADLEEIGRRLRNGLSELADMWGTNVEGDIGRLRAYHAEGAEPPRTDDERRAALSASAEGEIEKPRYAHATGNRVFRG